MERLKRLLGPFNFIFPFLNFRFEPFNVIRFWSSFFNISIPWDQSIFGRNIRHKYTKMYWYGEQTACILKGSHWKWPKNVLWQISLTYFTFNQKSDTKMSTNFRKISKIMEIGVAVMRSSWCTFKSIITIVWRIPGKITPWYSYYNHETSFPKKIFHYSVKIISIKQLQLCRFETGQYLVFAWLTH